MQLIGLASTAALLATVAASPSPRAPQDTHSFNLNDLVNELLPKVKIVNRCNYDVYLWSVLNGMGCPSSEAFVLKSGATYQENYRPAVNGVGTSIKLSKTSTCDPQRLLQLEYYIETNKPGYNYNYLDVSYVNAAETKDCPTANEGYYLKSGNQGGKFATSAVNSAICPIMSCSNFADCAKHSYVQWDDVQTKSCDPEADLDFYMCGAEAPGAEVPDVPETPPEVPSAAPSSTLVQVPSLAPSPTPTPSSAAVDDSVAAAAVTPAPVVSDDGPVHVKTEVVYVTEYAYVNAKKRHEHGHRHHQKFRA